MRKANANKVEKGKAGGGPMIGFFVCWSILLLLAMIDPPEKGTGTYRRIHGGLLALNILIFLLLILQKNDLPNMLRAAQRVTRWPFSSTVADYDHFFMIVCVIGAIITTIFVVDVGAASFVAVKTGAVIFILSLKVAFDRWRASKRKR